MEDREVTNYLITALIGAKVLIESKSEADEFIEFALSLFPGDEVNRAALECDNSQNGACKGLIEEFEKAVKSKWNGKIVGHHSMETEEGTAWLWKILLPGGKFTYLQTTELHTLNTTYGHHGPLDTVR